MSEKVNHPSHYAKKSYKSKECIEEMREKYGDANVWAFCLLNSYKYLFRAGAKDGVTYEEDVAKAKWYYEYADRLGCPFMDMAQFQLKKDIEIKLKKIENEAKKNDNKV